MIPWLNSNFVFPEIDDALAEPNGLLAAGGNLTPKIIIEAYSQGIFPWYNEDQPILWWSPDPRLILIPKDIKISKSLKKTLNKENFKVTFDKAFGKVISQCQILRKNNGTWITEEMKKVYFELHRKGYAHSCEVWINKELVGGLYGLAFNKIFFGESMFHLIDNCSKIALVYLAKHLVKIDYKLIDCQVSSEHLKSMGAIEIKRSNFKNILKKSNKKIAVNKKFF